METQQRVAARGLLMTPSGHTLLLKTRLQWTDAVWMVPGGGGEAGESLAQAAIREVAEETGLVRAVVGPELWWRNVEIALRDRRVLLREHYFLIEVDEFEPSFGGLEDYEVPDLLDHRWWSADEIASAADRFAPPELASLLDELLSSGPPATSRRIESRSHAG